MGSFFRTDFTGHFNVYTRAWEIQLAFPQQRENAYLALPCHTHYGVRVQGLVLGFCTAVEETQSSTAGSAQATAQEELSSDTGPAKLPFGEYLLADHY